MLQVPSSHRVYEKRQRSRAPIVGVSSMLGRVLPACPPECIFYRRRHTVLASRVGYFYDKGCRCKCGSLGALR